MLILPLIYAETSSAAVWWFRTGMILELLLIGLLPTFLAIFKRHPDAIQIILVNLFLGWTGIGWMFALMAAIKPVDILEPHICRNCHSVGIPNARPGKWFFGEGAWNAATLYKGVVPPLTCSKCNAPHPVPVSTPYGQELLRRSHFQQ